VRDGMERVVSKRVDVIPRDTGAASAGLLLAVGPDTGTERTLTAFSIVARRPPFRLDRRDRPPWPPLEVALPKGTVLRQTLPTLRLYVLHDFAA
jgi:hypothetical protein